MEADCSGSRRGGVVGGDREALGVSRQSAWEYFTRRVSTELAANVENSDLSEDEAMDIAVEEVRTVRRSRRAR